MTRPRILIVTRNLPPLVGGMERLNWHMAEELAKVAEVRVIGPEGSAAQASTGVTIREAPLKPLWKFLLRARSLARREARAFKPEVVLAGSGLTAPIARAAARTCGARTAVYVHGLDVAVRNVVYRALWLPAIRHADRVIANSSPTADLCRAIGVDPARIGIVHPGVDLPVDMEPLSPRERGRGEGPHPRQASQLADAVEPLSPRERGRGEGPAPHHAPNAAEPSNNSSFRTPRNGDPEPNVSSHPTPPATTFRQRHDLGNGPLLLSVGRLSERKGLREFVTLSLSQIVTAHPDAMLVIVGDAPRQALHAQAQTPESIQAAADAAGMGTHLRFLGKIRDPELEAAWQCADVHVFPVRQIPGDPEGFGMVAVEAAAHGVPTVAFATGGVVDAVADGRSGCLLAPGDYDAFARAVASIIAQREPRGDSCVAFARQFVWPQFGSRLAQQLALKRTAHDRP